MAKSAQSHVVAWQAFRGAIDPQQARERGVCLEGYLLPCAWGWNCSCRSGWQWKAELSELVTHVLQEGRWSLALLWLSLAGLLLI